MDKDKRIDLLCGSYDYLLNLMRVMGVDERDMEDLAEEAILAAYKSIDDLRDESRMKPWLRAIAANKAKRYFRERSRHRAISSTIRLESGEEIDIYDIVADETDVEKILQDAERRSMVETMLDNLSDINRRIIKMRFWGKYKFAEIADILNINVNTVKSIYRRSLKQLKRVYGELFGEDGPYEGK